MPLQTLLVILALVLLAGGLTVLAITSLGLPGGLVSLLAAIGALGMMQGRRR